MGIALLDCQVHTEHLARLGAHEVPRAEFMALLKHALDAPTRRGRWQFDLDLDAWAASGGAVPGVGPAAGPSSES